MKNKTLYVMALAVVTFFAACQKDNSVVDMKATIATYGNNGQKLYVDGDHYANWNNQDKVWINGTDYTVTLSSDNIAAINGVSVSENDYYAVYPTDRITASNSGYPTLLMPQVQIYKTDANGNQLINAPMAAYCASNATTHSLNFVNLCSLLEVNLPEECEVAYINVTSSDNFLWGMASITGGNNPVLSMNDANTSSVYTTENKTVTLDCSTNGYNGSDNNGGSTAATGTVSQGPFYVVIPARSYSALTVDVYIYTTNENGRRTVKRYRKAANTASNASIAENMIYRVVFSGDPEEDQPPYPYLGTGEFSVSPTKKVRFAMGNLQYQASTGMWRFAETQLVSFFAGEGNLVTTGRDSQPLWIDLFGYGTSGKGNPSYSPTTYAYNGSYATSTIAGTPYDWGVNEISNGGNQPNKWRTLTKSEWQYLMNTNVSTSSPRNNRQYITVVTDANNNEIAGVLIFPDDYPIPNSWNQVTTVLRPNINQYNAYIEDGAVFLPATGYYSDNYYTGLGLHDYTNPKDGYYWTSTYDGGVWTYKEVCSSNGGGTSISCYGGGQFAGYEGCAVRLVRDVD